LAAQQVEVTATQVFGTINCCLALGALVVAQTPQGRAAEAATVRLDVVVAVVAVELLAVLVAMVGKPDLIFGGFHNGLSKLPNKQPSAHYAVHNVRHQHGGCRYPQVGTVRLLHRPWRWWRRR
jgi:hypothetical protein